MAIFFTLAGMVCLVFMFGPRPKLRAVPQTNQIPDLPVAQLADWLAETEAAVANLDANKAAHIQWAEPSNPEKTRLSFLYVHGFSATWRETAPVTEKLAAHFKANIVQGRLKGHGTGPAGMLATAEDWLQSLSDQFELAQKIGDKVIIVATSTGAPLSVWLTSQPELAAKIHACLFMSPNFRVRSRMGFLLTWPWSKYWIHFIVGRKVGAEAASEAEASCWTSQYSSLALIEMQKTVDWATAQNTDLIHTPVSMMYMVNDGTIYPPAAIDMFNRWNSKLKHLYRVTLDGEAAEHVFAGDITAPHRTDWCVQMFTEFLEKVDAEP